LQLANLEVRGAVVADSHIGVSLNFVRHGYGYGSVLNSLIMGSTAMSTCSESTVCRAMAKGDVAGAACNSVFGRAWRRVGITTSQYTNLAKTCGVTGFEPCSPLTTPIRMWYVPSTVVLSRCCRCRCLAVPL
jgi:hypothetical protein